MHSLNSEYMNEASIYEKKWSEKGLLDGLPRKTKRDRDIRYATATILENQLLLNEQGYATGGPVGSGGDGAMATGHDDIAQFRRISVPMVRRFFPQLIAHNIVGVQPLLGPTGLVYYFRFRKATTKGQDTGVDTAGDVKWDRNNPDNGWDAASLQQYQSGDISLPIWYSHQRVPNDSVTGTEDTGVSGKYYFVLGKTPVLVNSAVAMPSDVVGNGNLTEGGQYTAWGTIVKGTTATYRFVVSGTTVTVYDTSDDAAPSITGTVSADTGTIAFSGLTTGQSDYKVVATYEYNLECQPDMPRINLVVESDMVEAKPRKLRADWSIEAQQDLRAQHNLDVEAELTSFLAEEVNLEIDREIVGDIRDNAGTTAVWDFSSALGDTIKEKYEALFVQLVAVSNQIHKKTLRHGANWIVTSPEICAIFESATAGFAPAPSENWESSIGIQYVGTVNSRWKIYKDPNFPQDQLIMGYRGDSMMDVGYFYCPYVALQQSPLLYDPESFCPRKGVMTRYGKILLRDGARYYARVAVANFFV